MADVYDIPSGPKNLAPLFPSVDFNQVTEYYIEVLDTTPVVIATSPLMKMGCCCDLDGVRLLFLNYCGKFDGMNFGKPHVVHESSSSTYKKGLNYPLVKTDTGTERFNVSSNDTFTCSTLCYNESDMEWAQELIDSPKAFLQWAAIQGQSDSYVPIVITSTKFDKKKIDDEWKNIITIEFNFSNEFIVIRN